MSKRESTISSRAGKAKWLRRRSRSTTVGLIAGAGLATLSLSEAATYFSSTSADGALVISVSGDDTYIANGASIAGPVLSVLVNEDVVVAGDGGGADDALRVTQDGYSITNNGTLGNSGATNGIFIGLVQVTSIVNNGTVIGQTGLFGNGGTAEIDSIINNGLIRGTVGTGLLTGNDTTISNFDEISGVVRGIGAGTGATIGNSVDGIIRASNGSGIKAGDNLDLTNFGLISGQGASGLGVDSAVGAYIYNSGIIRGDVDGVRIQTSPIVSNYVGGFIYGGVNGISTGDYHTLNNEGAVSGGLTAIVANNEALLYNYVGGIISSNTGDAISVADELLLSNGGLIRGGYSGDGDGVQAQNKAWITLYSSGQIIATNHGINTQNELLLETSGTIEGEDGGVLTGDDAIIKNFAGGLIDSTVNGNGIEAGKNLTLINEGFIFGKEFAVLTGDGVNVLTNFGMLRGANLHAVQMGAGNDTFNAFGGLIIGDVDGGDGTDTLNFDGTSEILGGDVLNFEIGTKTGAGRALVDGTANILALTLSEGALYVTEGYNGTSINATGGELGGLGDWNLTQIDLQSGAAFSAGEDIGQIAEFNATTINSGMKFFAGSALIVDMVPNGHWDLVTNNGALVIEAGAKLQVRPTNLLAPLYDNNKLIVFNNDLETPNFDHEAQFLINGNPFISSSVRLRSNLQDGNIWLSTEHDYTLVPGLSTQGDAIGEYLNTALPFAWDPDKTALAAYLANIDYSTPEDAAAAIEALGFSLNVIASDAIIHSGFTLNRTVENHNALRRSFGTPSGVASASPPSFDAKGTLTSQAQAASSTAPKNWNAWIAGSIESLDLDGGLANVEGDSRQLTVGADFQFGPMLTVGVLGQLAKVDMDGGASEVEVETDYFGAYASYGGADGLFVDALLAYGDHELDTLRPLAGIGQVIATAEATSWNALIGGGYLMGANGFSWGPVAALEYQSLDLGRETGILVTQGRDVESLRALLGLMAQRDMNVGSRPLRIYGSARWAHDFMADEDRTVAAGFFGVPGSFSTSAADRAKNALLLNAGIHLGLSDAVTVGLGYFGEVSIEGDGISSHGAMLEAKLAF